MRATIQDPIPIGEVPRGKYHEFYRAFLETKVGEALPVVFETLEDRDLAYFAMRKWVEYRGFGRVTRDGLTVYLHAEHRGEATQHG